VRHPSGRVPVAEHAAGGTLGRGVRRASRQQAYAESHA
jgi:hypothetical protein